jgi:hypothetical protein
VNGLKKGSANRLILGSPSTDWEVESDLHQEAATVWIVFTFTDCEVSEARIHPTCLLDLAGNWYTPFQALLDTTGSKFALASGEKRPVVKGTPINELLRWAKEPDCPTLPVRESMEAGRIRFRFEEKKATTAAGLLLKIHGRRMPYFLLVKLIVLAELESLKRRGWPISGDDIFAMERGPIPSTIYDLAKEKFGLGGYWGEFIRRAGEYDVELLREPDLDQLSEAEIEILRDVYEADGEKHALRISERLHKEHPDWKTDGGSRRIPFEEILRAIGKNDKEIAEIAVNSAESNAIHDLLRG